MTKLRILTVLALFFGAVGLSAADTLQMDGTAAGRKFIAASPWRNHSQC